MYKITISDKDYNILRGVMIDDTIRLILNNADIRQISVDKPVYVDGALTDKKMRSLFGTNYNGIVYYNYDKSRWNMNKYSHLIGEQPDNFASIAQPTKDALERLNQWRDLELVGLVVMPIKFSDFRGWGNPISNPTFVAAGATNIAMAGTVVLRNRTSRQILPIPENWVGVGTVWWFDKDLQVRNSFGKKTAPGVWDDVALFLDSLSYRKHMQDSLLKIYGR